MLPRLFHLALVPFLLPLSLVHAQDATALSKALDDAGIEALFPDELEYANASVSYNTEFIVQPFAIAYPVGASQVSAALKAAVAQDLNVVSRSGGHSYIANSLGGKNGSFVIDLVKNKNITVDEESGVATIETGLRLGDIALALNEHGRAMPHGRCSFVGIGGHSAHGGWGHFSREWGLVVDVVKHIEVVLADGSIVNASEEENTELFWALRGSGSSFGVVTQIKVETFPAPPEFTAYTYIFGSLPTAQVVSAILSFQSFAVSDIPSTYGGQLYLSKGTAEGQVSLQFTGGYLGSHDSFNDTVQPFLDTLPPPTNTTTIVQANWIEGLAAWVFLPLNTSTSVDFSAAQYMKSIITPEDDPMTEAALQSFVSYFATEGFSSDLDLWQVEIELYGGTNSAMNKVQPDATSFPHRSGLFNLQFLSANIAAPLPESAFEFTDGAANALISAEPEDWAWESYVGYPDLRLGDQALDLYYGDGLPRLKELKKKYDAQDVFNFPLSIPLA